MSFMSWLKFLINCIEQHIINNHVDNFYIDYECECLLGFKMSYKDIFEIYLVKKLFLWGIWKGVVFPTHALACYNFICAIIFFVQKRIENFFTFTIRFLFMPYEIDLFVDKFLIDQAPCW